MRTATYSSSLLLGEERTTRRTNVFSLRQKKKEDNQKRRFRKAVEDPLERKRQLLMEGKEPIDAALITLGLK